MPKSSITPTPESSEHRETDGCSLTSYIFSGEILLKPISRLPRSRSCGNGFSSTQTSRTRTRTRKTRSAWRPGSLSPRSTTGSSTPGGESCQRCLECAEQHRHYVTVYTQRTHQNKKTQLSFIMQNLRPPVTVTHIPRAQPSSKFCFR